MKYSKLVLLALLLSVVVMATAQNNDPVVVKINKEEIKLSEFKNTFAKNNNLQTTTKADLDNYIDLYVDFRLKYAEALALQLDTITRLQNELAGYRDDIYFPMQKREKMEPNTSSVVISPVILPR